MTIGAARTSESDSIRVLAIDDQQSLLSLLRTYLERDPDLSVEVVTQGTDAVERLRDGTFDCIVSDYLMEEMSGLTLLERTREELGLDIPFIIFTGNSREDVAIDALNLGANRYIQKGGDPETQFSMLVNAIRTEVDYHRNVQLAREYERRLEIAQGIADFGIIDWNLTTDEVYCTQNLREMFGLPHDTPLTIADLEWVMHPDDKEQIQAALEAAIEGETAEYSMTHRIKRPDGGVRWMKNVARLVHDGNGDPVRLLGVALDITEEKRGG